MYLTFLAPFDAPRHVQVSAPQGHTLGQICATHSDSITACQVNGAFLNDWSLYLPQENDRITFFLRTGAIATTTIITAVVVALISAAISIGISYLIRALTPTPSNQAGKVEQVFGLAGLTNTTAFGTPKFLVYGTRRVFGHIISTRTAISTDGKTTAFGALYFMGEGPIQGITNIEINDTSISQFPGVTTYTRPGDGVNTPVIPGFRTVSQVWNDNRTLSATPIVYTTRSTAVEQITLIFSTAYLFRINSNGVHLGATHTIKVEYSLVSPVSYVEATGSPISWSENTESQRFRTFGITTPSNGQYLVRVTLTSTTNQSAVAPTLFNVQEEASGNLLYVNSALLAVTGVASNQITSFEGMRVSGLVQGRKVKIWNGASFTTAYTANRAWIVRDMLTNSRVGLGHRIAESMFDDDAALTVANYWDEIAQGSTTRDECHLLVNDRRAAWDWIKTVLAEGRAALIPSGGKFKIVVDKAGTPNLLYGMPGNIIEGSVTQFFGNNQGLLPNTIRGQFPDKDNGYQLQVLEVIAPGAESEPTREELVTIYTLTDVARVFWLLRYQALKSRLVRRTFRWRSPISAMVSEPFDQASFSYETQDAARGFSGFCGAESTTTRVVLDRLVTLAAATTYDLIIRHQATNTVERKVVATGAGTWGAIAPTVALTTAPAEGDLYALGVQTTAILPVVITDAILEDDGTYQLTAVEYQATIHDTPAPPTIAASGGERQLPLPLWNASITNEVVTNVDGGINTMLIFEVTPGLPGYGGPVASATSTTLALTSTFPTIDDYFNTATLAIVEGTGTGQSRTIDDYTGSTRTCTVTAWTTIPDATSLFTITWGPFDDFAGFLLEARQGTDPYSAYDASATFSTTRLTREAEGGNYTMDVRFTPVGVLGQINTQGRWVISVTVVGDSATPDSPTDEIA